jgi:uncharacterized repeat protein (TIGR03803 family)
MKKTILLAASVLFLMAGLNAQPVLYGLTELGGNSAGSIARYDVSTNTLSSVFTYPNDGISPALTSSPIQASNGFVYGMTNRGGKFNYGTIYTINEDGTGFRKIHDFDFINGADPRGTLFQASNGLIYGLTLTGGASGQGTLFRFDPVAETVTKLHEFVDAEGNRQGQRPFGGLVEYGGRLYGMLSSGGLNNQGSIFSIALDGTGFTKHHDFIDEVGGQREGANPFGSLLKASDGLLYGMTNLGGTNNRGIIFSFDPVSILFAKRFDFGATTPVRTGANPFGDLIEDASGGKLYGLTYAGGANNQGVAFSFIISTNTYTNLYSLNNIETNIDGRAPSGSLVQALDGSLFGLTSLGGLATKGTIFRLNADGSGYTVLRQLSQADGQTPYGTPLLLRTGKLVATPSQKGDGFNGTILLYSQDGTSFSKVHDFNFVQGAFPRGSLIQGRNGNLYGMTYGGGAYGQGTIFSFQAASGTFNRLHSFQNNGNVNDGSNPFGSLTETADGTLFGMASIGGANNQGVIFSIGPDGTNYMVRHAFNRTSGRSPYGNLVLATDGLLYGMTSEGGAANLGVIFSFNPVSNTFSLLHSFNGTNGSLPRGSLLPASDGLLYGLTRGGGANGLGTLFSFKTSDNTFTVLHSFVDEDGDRGGSSPSGSLAENADGVLYGLTAGGGAFGHGTVFSFDPVSGTFATRASLDDNNQQGKFPLGSMTLASDKVFYAMTSSGGANNRGTLFSFDPATGLLEKRQDFNLENGASPLYSDLLEPGRCRPPVVQCPRNIRVTAPAGTCSAPVTLNATTTDYCPNTSIRYYLSYGTPSQTEINSSYTFPVGVTAVTALAANLLNEQSSCTFNVTVVPGQLEICGNNVDDDCDGWVDETCTPRLRIWDTTVTEATGLARIRVTLSGISENEVSVNFATKEKSAKSPHDFTARSGFVTFLPGETLKYIDIPIVQDHVKEKTEDFELNLSNLLNATIDNSSGTPFKAKVTILDGGSSNITQGRPSDVALLSDQPRTGVWPNPSPSTFRLRLEGYENAIVHIRVTDLQGRLVEQRQVPAGTRETDLGAQWGKGTYFVEVTQGAQRSLLRLVKL